MLRYSIALMAFAFSIQALALDTTTSKETPKNSLTMVPTDPTVPPSTGGGGGGGGLSNEGPGRAYVGQPKSPPTTLPPVIVTETPRPSNEQPVAKVPELPRPSTEQPIAKVPESPRPSTEQPIAKVPESPRPSTEQPIAKVPELPRPSTEQPIAKVPELPRPSTEQPIAKVPESPRPSIDQPLTKVPETPRPFEPPIQKSCGFIKNRLNVRIDAVQALQPLMSQRNSDFEMLRNAQNQIYDLGIRASQTQEASLKTSLLNEITCFKEIATAAQANFDAGSQAISKLLNSPVSEPIKQVENLPRQSGELRAPASNTPTIQTVRAAN